MLLDANLPRTLGALLPGHHVQSVHTRRWSDLDDGPLLDTAERDYDAFVTADQNLRFQQNLRGRTPRIIVLRAPRTSLPILAPSVPAILTALSEMIEGELRIVAA